MNNQKSIQKKVLNAIGGRIRHLGYKANLGRQIFYTKTFFGKQALHIAFMPHRDDLDISADVAIRFDALEEVIQEFGNMSASAKVKSLNRFSFGANIGHLLGKGQIRWTVSSEDDIEEVGSQIAEEFSRVGLQYFERYSSLSLAFEVLLENGEEAKLLNPIPSKMATNAVAISFLLGDINKFRLASDRMMSFLSSIPNGGSDELQNLIDELEKQLDG